MYYTVYESKSASSWPVTYECETFEELSKRVLSETDWESVENVDFNSNDLYITCGWTRDGIVRFR